MTAENVEQVAEALFKRCKELEDRIYCRDLTIRKLKDALRDAEERLNQFGETVSYF